MWTPQHLRKIFIGGLDPSTTNDSLQTSFSDYGDIVDCIVMKDPVTNRSRGFGFITFANPDQVDDVQKKRPHKVDGKLVETKRAVPRNEGANINAPSHGDGGGGHSRIFIGGLPQDAKENDLEQYFKHFGEVMCINIMYDKVSGRHRGFAFVDFSDYDHVDKVLLTHTHSIKGKPIDVKKAMSKGEVIKLKALVGGGPNQDAAALAFSGLGGFQGIPNLNASIANNNLPAGPSATNGKSPGGNPNENNNVMNNAALTRMMQMGALGNPFMPGIPMGAMPGFHPQVPSGWRYSISNNAEILHNTALESDGESDCSLDDQVMETEDGVFPSTSTSISLPLPWKSSQANDISSPNAKVLFLEPFFGGCHQRLIESLKNDQYFFSPENLSLFTLPAKKRHWKARTSALYFYQIIPKSHNFKVLFASSTLNLCELLSLRPDLSNVKKILYFHENQLAYPIHKQKNEFQFGYNQILSCLVADTILFNSQYNLESFIREIPRFLKHQPGYRPSSTQLVEDIKGKSEVLYFPVVIHHKTRPPKDALEPLHIIWPHSWEQEKDPDTFFQVLFQLAEAGLNFRVIVLGEAPSADVPPIFAEAKQKLSNFIIHFGNEKDKEKYWELLHSGDVVVSTAHHDFFCSSMLEAVGAGCIPLCPNRVVYPEIYSQDCLYNTTEQFQKTLGQWCSRPQLVRSRKVTLDLNVFSWQNLRPKFLELFCPALD